MDKWEYLAIEIQIEELPKELDEKLREEQKRLNIESYGEDKRFQVANKLGFALTRKIKHFDELGKQGWELVSIYGYAYFKRKIE